jgi:hypothetical protein
VRVGGGTHLARVLAALPEMAAAEQGVIAALRAGAPTLRSRLLRLAERGDTRALRIAAASGAAGVVPLLARTAMDDDAGRARAAVDLLAAVDTLPAWIALARALGGELGPHVAERLRGAPPTLDGALSRRARTSLRDAPAAIDALATRGAVRVLRELAASSRLAPYAVQALARADGAAAATLLELAATPALKGRVLDALAARLDDGRDDAGPALLALARAGQERAVMRVLSARGATGRRLLREAARDPRLAPRARHALERLPAARGAARVARRRTAGTNSRSI